MSELRRLIVAWFGQAGISAPALTPDGQTLTVLGPHPATGAATVLTLDLTSDGATLQPLLAAHERDLRFQNPTRDGSGVIVIDDPDIDRWFDLAHVTWGGARRSLVPAGLRNVRPLEVPRDRPHELLVRANSPDGSRPVFAIDLPSAAAQVRHRHLDALDVVVGPDGFTAVARVPRANGGVRLERLVLGGSATPKVLVDRIPSVVEAIPWALERSGRLWLGASIGGHARQLCSLQPGRTTVTSSVAVDGLDVDPPILHDASGQVMAARVTDDLPGLVPVPLDASATPAERRRHEQMVAAVHDSATAGASLQHWSLVGAQELRTISSSDRSPVSLVGPRQSPLVVPHRPQMGADRPTARVDIPASDGVLLRSYLTTAARPEGALVLRIHGGPWERDDASWDPLTQTLARAGIGVLRVNYRGSTGFGADHASGAIDEFDGRVLDDLRDAIHYAVRAGLGADERIGVMGHSFGGYLSLLLATRLPHLVSAAVSWSGPPDLHASLIAMSDRTDRTFTGTWVQAAGDPATSEGRVRLAEASPLTHVAALRAPTLIIGGAHDPRVPIDSLRAFAYRARATGTHITELLFNDEGHGIRRPANRIQAVEAIVSHLHQHLHHPHQGA